ncbi:MAG: chemotaxis protein histidine kinase CheA [Verrucomicrobiales bacterium]|jgi:chemotaxis protein histidine kinase CheA
MSETNEKTTSNQQTGRFAAAGEAAVKRLNLVHWLRCLRSSALPVCGGSLLVILSLRYFGVRWADWLAALAIVGLWLLGGFLWAAMRKPSRFAALAAWDESAGRKEALASAEFFEGKPALTEGEKLHLLRSEQILKDAEKSLSQDLPLPKMIWQWALPLLVLLFSFSPLLKPQLGAEDRKLSDEASEVAKAEADKLKEVLDDLEKAQGLTAEEKKKYDEVVKNARDTTAKELQQAGDKSTREVLKELEERARAAEKLAKELGGEDDKWASEEMLEEMGKHADTADLADAIKGKKATKSANEARQIADNLKSDKLTNEVESRVDKALEKTADKADEKDAKKPVGKHFKTASKRMKAKKTHDAAAEFEKLAQEFDTKAQRERAKKQMQKLAKQLRNAGSKIAGKNMGGMQKLAGKQNKGMKLLKMPPGFEQNQMQKLGKSQAMRMQNMPMMQMPPGMKPGKPGQGKPMAMAPVPGMTPKPGMGMVPGMGQKPGAGMGMIPVPGMGAGQGMGMAAQGGLQAGAGTSGLGNAPTKPNAAKLNSTVNAKINADGDVSMRAVEGEVRGEAAGRTATAERVEFVNVQEEALDEATLPSSRRAHVKRYFDLLREQFEAQEGE